APLSPVPAPVAAPLAPVLAPVTAPLGPALAPVTAPLGPALAPVTAPLGPALAPVTAPVAAATGPPATTVELTGVAGSTTTGRVPDLPGAPGPAASPAAQVRAAAVRVAQAYRPRTRTPA